jgi:hypothetical protein
MAPEKTDTDQCFERLTIRLEFAVAGKWLRENTLWPDQPTVGIMLSSKPEKPRPTMWQSPPVNASLPAKTGAE